MGWAWRVGGGLPGHFGGDLRREVCDLGTERGEAQLRAGSREGRLLRCCCVLRRSAPHVHRWRTLLLHLLLLLLHLLLLLLLRLLHLVLPRLSEHPPQRLPRLSRQRGKPAPPTSPPPFRIFASWRGGLGRPGFARDGGVQGVEWPFGRSESFECRRDFDDRLLVRTLGRALRLNKAEQRAQLRLLRLERRVEREARARKLAEARVRRGHEHVARGWVDLPRHGLPRCLGRRVAQRL
ncbi:hypothetical protein T492DRAFT_1023425 [Pavlovales sp. CCMP2436]|nr:hypothetical protein T492DRAFT_1023425 [Pavlovales sp. CCMP2436]|mmetsp:Transcript_1043/g.2690  ORF Transcript_1043/g.2690 Transcript_1043/m.2690 type:complete len:237 (+) Transcript_1043:84-794(+)